MLSGTRLVGSGTTTTTLTIPSPPAVPSKSPKNPPAPSAPAAHVDDSTVLKSVSCRQNRYLTTASATTSFKELVVSSRNRREGIASTAGGEETARKKHGVGNEKNATPTAASTAAPNPHTPIAAFGRDDSANRYGASSDDLDRTTTTASGRVRCGPSATTALKLCCQVAAVRAAPRASRKCAVRTGAAVSASAGARGWINPRTNSPRLSTSRTAAERIRAKPAIASAGAAAEARQARAVVRGN